MDANTGNVLYEKNANSLMYPASTTKVLTAIIAIESCPLDTKITASEQAITAIKSGYTNAKIQSRRNTFYGRFALCTFTKICQ